MSLDGNQLTNAAVCHLPVPCELSQDCLQNLNHTSAVCAAEWSKLRGLHTVCMQGGPQQRDLTLPCFSFSQCAAGLPQRISIPTSFLLASVPTGSPASQPPPEPNREDSLLVHRRFYLRIVSCPIHSPPPPISKVSLSHPQPLISTSVYN